MTDTPNPSDQAWRRVLDATDGLGAYVDTDAPGVPGAIRVLHIPQVPGPAFAVGVPDYDTAKRLDAVLVAYDLFQFHNRIKPDYSNMTIIEVADADGGWCSLDDDETPDGIYHPFMVGTPVKISDAYTPAYLAGSVGQVIDRGRGGTDVEVTDPAGGHHRVLLSDSDLTRLDPADV